MSVCVVVLSILALSACGKKPKVALFGIKVGDISVGMDEASVPDRFKCKWEVLTSTQVRGPSSFVCPDGEMSLDLAPFGQFGSALTTVRLYKRPRDTVVSGFSVSVEPPLTSGLREFGALLAKHYEAVIGLPPITKGNTYNWKVQGVAFFIHMDEDTRRIVLATFPAF
jgi:hypothetical protein